MHKKYMLYGSQHPPNLDRHLPMAQPVVDPYYLFHDEAGGTSYRFGLPNIFIAQNLIY